MDLWIWVKYTHPKILLSKVLSLLSTHSVRQEEIGREVLRGCIEVSVLIIIFLILRWSCYRLSMPNFKSCKSCQKVAKVVKNCKSCQKATKVADTKKLSIHSLFEMVEAHENMFDDQVDLL